MIRFAMRVAFWLANRNEQARKLMQGWNRNVQFQIDKVAPFYVLIRDGSAVVSPGLCENPNLVMKASEASFRRMLRGEIQFEEAFIRKQIEAIGSVHDAARFKRIIGIVLERHAPLISVFRSVFGRFI